MEITVDGAFKEYMRDYVNLDPNVVYKAKESKDNLLKNIHKFSNNNFFNLCPDFDIQFGSFARKTKCRELDDIDLMIGISADGATYNSLNGWEKVKIYASISNESQMDCMNDDGTLNSTKVLNRFKAKLEDVNDYSRSELHRNGEAVTLNLISRDWVFDIVPCFHTVKEDDGRDYYLIPNGKGNWKKTDPSIDRDLVKNINSQLNNNLLPLIRLCKKWNEHKKVITLPSYLMETILVNLAKENRLSNCLRLNFMDALKYISSKIYSSVYDMKGIQGNINSLKDYQQKQISDKATEEASKVYEALVFEVQEKDMRKAINKWREIFGEDFPKYE